MRSLAERIDSKNTVIEWVTYGYRAEANVLLKIGLASREFGEALLSWRVTSQQHPAIACRCRRDIRCRRGGGR